MSFTAKEVKKLREMTGAGMMACRDALRENAGNLTESVTYLRKKGLAAAQKKQSRIAAEGRVATGLEGTRGVVVEVNCETDFVAKGDDFKAFTEEVASFALRENIETVDVLGERKAEEVNELILKCGEKVEIRRFVALRCPGGTVGEYNHGGKIGVLVGLETSSKEAESLARDLAMHIAACDPKFVRTSDMDEDFKNREVDIYKAQLRAQGKPEKAIGHILEGKLRKLATQVCLLEQKFVKDQNKTVKQLLKETGGVNISGFVRIPLGEGVEKREANLAQEVADITGKQ